MFYAIYKGVSTIVGQLSGCYRFHQLLLQKSVNDHFTNLIHFDISSTPWRKPRTYIPVQEKPQTLHFLLDLVGDVGNLRIDFAEGFHMSRMLQMMWETLYQAIDRIPATFLTVFSHYRPMNSVKKPSSFLRERVCQNKNKCQYFTNTYTLSFLLIAK